MELHANSSNNTVYADADGHIAYFHPQFVPRRDDRFDWTAGGRQRSRDRVARRARRRGQPARDGSAERLDPEHQRLAVLGGGAVQPASARSSRLHGRRRREPARAARDPGAGGAEGFHPRAAPRRGVRQLSHGLRAARAAAAGGLRLAAGGDDPLKAKLAEPIAALRGWDYRWSAGSVATSLAVYWGETLAALAARRGRAAGMTVYDYMATRATPAERLGALAAAAGRLTRDFGTLADAVGRDQPVPAAHRRHRASRSTTRGRASRCRSPRRDGARSRRSGHGRIRARSGCTAPTATASSRWSSSGRTACGRRR